MKLSASDIVKRFRASGRRVTPQRVAVFEVLCKQGGHPTVDQIYREVRKRFSMISLNTVYQAVESLVDLKVVSPVSHGLEAARYETDNKPHHHAVCIACKGITDIFDPGLGRVMLPRAMRDRFQVLSHKVEFFGYCADCRSSGADHLRGGNRRRGRSARASLRQEEREAKRKAQRKSFEHVAQKHL